MRRILAAIVIVNVAAIAIAWIGGFLPSKLLDYEQPSLSGEPLIRIFGDDISISNSLFTMWLVMALLIVIGFVVTRDLREQPGPLQNALELVVQGLGDFVEGIGGAGTRRYVPLFGTLFLFLLISNYLGLVPFVGAKFALGGAEVEPLRAPSSDYHVNLGLALTSFVIYQQIGIRKHGASYFGRFINLSGFRAGMPSALFMGPIMLFVGAIELIADVLRLLTLTLRLWGNIYAGEFAIAVVGSLVIVPILVFPFIGLELLVGLVQSLVFAMLVLVYIVLALESHEEEEGHAEQHGPAESVTAKEVAHA
ncbi:MAG TPA: F0F1 ATP synthase subunit A [Candidatus Dormibacteraeota bacterium]|nr:F0F1 ATP synthase subunit A [Candidatus Dormibacteraeota bacterium]